jgi:hypothetical protein
MKEVIERGSRAGHSPSVPAPVGGAESGLLAITHADHSRNDPDALSEGATKLYGG